MLKCGLPEVFSIFCMAASVALNIVDDADMHFFYPTVAVVHLMCLSSIRQ